MKRRLIASFAALSIIAAPAIATTTAKADSAKPTKPVKPAKVAKTSKAKPAKPAKDAEQVELRVLFWSAAPRGKPCNWPRAPAG